MGIDERRPNGDWYIYSDENQSDNERGSLWAEFPEVAV